MKNVMGPLLGFLIGNFGPIPLHGDAIAERAALVERFLGEAQAAAETIQEENNRATDKALALVAVAFGWIDAGMPERAEAVFARIGEINAKDPDFPHSVVWRMAIERARRNDLDAAMKLVMTIPIPENRSPTLQEMIRLFRKRGNAVAAATAALQLPASIAGGGAPRRIALLSLVDWQIENDDLRGAARTAELFAELWERDPALNALAQAQAHHGNASDAAQTVGEIRSPETKVAALTAVADASAQAGDEPASREAFLRATELAKRLTDFNGARVSPVLPALGAIARAQWAAADVESARKTVELMRSIGPAAPGDREANEHVLAVADASVGDFDRAQAAVNAFRGDKRQWRKACGFNSIAVLAAGMGRQEQADAAFARAGAEAAALKAASDQRHAFEVLAEGLLKTGRIDAATEYALKLATAERNDLLREIIAAQLARGNIAEALLLTKSLAGSSTLREANEMIAPVQFHRGDLAAALKLASNDSGKTGSALRQIFEAQLAARDADGALQTFSHIQTWVGSEFETRLAELAAIQVRGGDWQAAYAWAMARTRPDTQAQALVGVARGLLKK